MEKQNLIFDATILLKGAMKNNQKTGIYRVTEQILRKLIERDMFSIYLFDSQCAFERETKIYVLPDYNGVKLLRMDSTYKIYCIDPFFNIADILRAKQLKSRRFFFVLWKLLKNCFLQIGSFLNKFETKKQKTFSFISENDIYFSSHHPLPNLFKAHKSIIVHDLIPFLYPELCWGEKESSDLLERIINTISIEDTVFCVSQHTKNDLLRYRPELREENIKVMYLAGAECFIPIHSQQKWDTVKAKYSIPDEAPYFLSVCTIEPRKNITLLVAAYENLIKGWNKKQPYPVLVLTGGYGWKSESLLEDIARINKNYPKAIILTGWIPDEELAVLYSNTNAFVYPSLYEGFGLPPLEAMQCGAPVITSNVSSLPEVVGDAGIQISPDDVEGLKSALEYCLGKKFVEEMRIKSLARAREFSWDKTVEAIIRKLSI